MASWRIRFHDKWPHLASLYASTHNLDEDGKNPDPLMGQDNVFDPSEPIGAYRYYVQPSMTRSEFSMEEPSFMGRPGFKDEESRSSDYTSGDSLKRGSNWRVLLCVFLVFSFIGVVVAAVTLAVLLSKSPTPRQPRPEVIDISARILGDEFDVRLLDNSSAMYKQKEIEVCDAMKAMFITEDTPIQNLVQCVVVEFLNGSIIARVRLQIIPKNDQKGEIRSERRMLQDIKEHFIKKVKQEGSWQSVNWDRNYIAKVEKVEPIVIHTTTTTPSEATSTTSLQEKSTQTSVVPDNVTESAPGTTIADATSTTSLTTEASSKSIQANITTTSMLVTEKTTVGTPETTTLTTETSTEPEATSTTHVETAAVTTEQTTEAYKHTTQPTSTFIPMIFSTDSLENATLASTSQVTKTTPKSSEKTTTAEIQTTEASTVSTSFERTMTDFVDIATPSFDNLTTDFDFNITFPAETSKVTVASETPTIELVYTQSTTPETSSTITVQMTSTVVSPADVATTVTESTTTSTTITTQEPKTSAQLTAEASTRYVTNATEYPYIPVTDMFTEIYDNETTNTTVVAKETTAATSESTGSTTEATTFQTKTFPSTEIVTSAKQPSQTIPTEATTIDSVVTDTIPEIIIEMTTISAETTHVVSNNFTTNDSTWAVNETTAIPIVTTTQARELVNEITTEDVSTKESTTRVTSRESTYTTTSSTPASTGIILADNVTATSTEITTIVNATDYDLGQTPTSTTADILVNVTGEPAFNFSGTYSDFGFFTDDYGLWNESTSTTAIPDAIQTSSGAATAYEYTTTDQTLLNKTTTMTATEVTVGTTEVQTYANETTTVMATEETVGTSEVQTMTNETTTVKAAEETVGTTEGRTYANETTTVKATEETVGTTEVQTMTDETITVKATEETVGATEVQTYVNETTTVKATEETVGTTEGQTYVNETTTVKATEETVGITKVQTMTDETTTVKATEETVGTTEVQTYVNETTAVTATEETVGTTEVQTMTDETTTVNATEEPFGTTEVLTMTDETITVNATEEPFGTIEVLTMTDETTTMKATEVTVGTTEVQTTANETTTVTATEETVRITEGYNKTADAYTIVSDNETSTSRQTTQTPDVYTIDYITESLDNATDADYNTTYESISNKTLSFETTVIQSVTEADQYTTTSQPDVTTTPATKENETTISIKESSTSLYVSQTTEATSTELYIFDNVTLESFYNVTEDVSPAYPSSKAFSDFNITGDAAATRGPREKSSTEASIVAPVTEVFSKFLANVTDRTRALDTNETVLGNVSDVTTKDMTGNISTKASPTDTVKETTTTFTTQDIDLLANDTVLIISGNETDANATDFVTPIPKSNATEMERKIPQYQATTEKITLAKARNVTRGPHDLTTSANITETTNASYDDSMFINDTTSIEGMFFPTEGSTEASVAGTESPTASTETSVASTESQTASTETSVASTESQTASTEASVASIEATIASAEISTASKDAPIASFTEGPALNFTEALFQNMTDIANVTDIVNESITKAVNATDAVINITNLVSDKNVSAWENVTDLHSMPTNVTSVVAAANVSDVVKENVTEIVSTRSPRNDTSKSTKDSVTQEATTEFPYLDGYNATYFDELYNSTGPFTFNDTTTVEPRSTT